MVNLLEDPVVEEAASPISLADEAILAQARIDALKIELEVMTARRDELAEACVKQGIEVYGGYRFTVKNPSDTMSERRFADLHGELFDRFISWSKETSEVKLTKKGVTEFLKAIGHDSPSKVIADITIPGKGQPTYGMRRSSE